MTQDEFVGALVIAGISAFLAWLATKRHHEKIVKELSLSAWNALKSETNICFNRASVFSRDKIISPQYRLPTMAYMVCLPLLVNHGMLEADEAWALTEFYAEVDSLNLGIENANTLLLSTDPEHDKLLTALHPRNKIKADNIITNFEATLRPILIKRLASLGQHHDR